MTQLTDQNFGSAYLFGNKILVVKSSSQFKFFQQKELEFGKEK